MLSLNKHTNSTQRDSLWSLVPSQSFSWCDFANVCQVALISWSTCTSICDLQNVGYSDINNFGGIVHKYSQILVSETVVSVVFGSRFCGKSQNDHLIWNLGLERWLRKLAAVVRSIWLLVWSLNIPHLLMWDKHPGCAKDSVQWPNKCDDSLLYPPVNKHGNGKLILSRCISYWNWGCSTCYLSLPKCKSTSQPKPLWYQVRWQNNA